MATLESRGRTVDFADHKHWNNDCLFRLGCLPTDPDTQLADRLAVTMCQNVSRPIQIGSEWPQNQLFFVHRVYYVEAVYAFRSLSAVATHELPAQLVLLDG